MLILLIGPLRSQDVEMKNEFQKIMPNACTLVVCSPAHNGLPGRDGQDGREGPRGEKGDPGRAGTTGLSWWEGVGIGIVTDPLTLDLLLWKTRRWKPASLGRRNPPDIQFT